MVSIRKKKYYPSIIIKYSSYLDLCLTVQSFHVTSAADTLCEIPVNTDSNLKDLKVTDCFSGVATEQLYFCLPFRTDKSRLHFERAAFSREGNKKSEMLFPFVKITEKYGDVPTHI